MHAVHLDTFPPVSYLTDTSHAVIRLVHALNKHFGRNLVALLPPCHLAKLSRPYIIYWLLLFMVLASEIKGSVPFCQEFGCNNNNNNNTNICNARSVS